MRRNCCHGFLAFSLKFFNFLQFFVGISVVIYSVYVLNQWNSRAPVAPPPSIAPAPGSPFLSFSSSEATANPDFTNSLYFAAEMVSGTDELPDLGLNGLPAPWFIYCFLGVGVILCCISCIGHIAAEAINGCCLYFYTLLITALLLLEGVLVAFIALDRSWEKVVPIDQTGELESLTHFIKENAEICKWVGITLLATQAISLLLACILRAMVTTQRRKSDIEDNYADARGANREPLLTTYPGQASTLLKGEARSTLSEIWAARMREKYGLHSGNQNPTMKTVS